MASRGRKSAIKDQALAALPFLVGALPFYFFAWIGGGAGLGIRQDGCYSGQCENMAGIFWVAYQLLLLLSLLSVIALVRLRNSKWFAGSIILLGIVWPFVLTFLMLGLFERLL